jgi:hypothetical protein
MAVDEIVIAGFQRHLFRFKMSLDEIPSRARVKWRPTLPVSRISQSTDLVVGAGSEAGITAWWLEKNLSISL